MVWGDKRLSEMFGSRLGTVNPASVNLRLGDTFLRPRADQLVVLGGHVEYDAVHADNGELTMRPGEFILATTAETVRVPRVCAAFVQGRSSIGRAGLSVQNAGFVDPGFEGKITLELKNDTPCPIVLKVGYEVAQLVLMDAADVVNLYRGKYQGQDDVTGSRMYMDAYEDLRG